MTTYALPTDDAVIVVTMLLDSAHACVEVDQLPGGSRRARVDVTPSEEHQMTAVELRELAAALQQAATLLD